MDETYEPAILQAFFTVNPVYEGNVTVLRVRAADLPVVPQAETFQAGEIAAGEV